MTHLLLADLNSGMIADIVVLAIVAIFAIFNLTRGFFKQIFKVICAIGSLVIAYLFCNDLLAFINAKFGLDHALSQKILGSFGESAALLQELTAENLTAAISGLGLPEFITDFAVKTLETVTLDLYANIGEYLAHIVSHYALLGGSFVVLYLVARLVLFLVSKLLALLIKLPVIRGIDKFLGLVWGLLQAFILIFVCFYLIDVLPINALQPVKDSISNSLIASFLQEHNLFTQLMDWAMTKITF